VAEISTDRRVRGPAVRLELRNEQGACLFAPAPIPLLEEEAKLARGERRRLSVSIDNRLLPGTYTLGVELTRTTPRGRHAPVSEASTVAFSIAPAAGAVGGGEESRGLVHLDCEARLEAAVVKAVA
jgi:hypothetical protein